MQYNINKFHKGGQPEGQISIMLGTYSTSRLIETKTICYSETKEEEIDRQTDKHTQIDKQSHREKETRNEEKRCRSIAIHLR